nr:HAD-IA family hydrolase [Mycobacterium nebraskense]
MPLHVLGHADVHRDQLAHHVTSGPRKAGPGYAARSSRATRGGTVAPSSFCSGLAEFFEHQLSVDARRAFKPAPAVYRYLCETLGVAPADCMMVAAHVWDTLGAQNVGFSAALIARPGNPPLPVDGLPQPNLVVSDVRQLAQQLIAGRRHN